MTNTPAMVATKTTEGAPTAADNVSESATETANAPASVDDNNKLTGHVRNTNIT